VCVGLLPLKYRQSSRKAHLSEAEPEAAPPSGGVGRGSVLAWPLAGLERSGLGSALLFFCAHPASSPSHTPVAYTWSLGVTINNDDKQDSDSTTKGFQTVPLWIPFLLLAFLVLASVFTNGDNSWMSSEQRQQAEGEKLVADLMVAPAKASQQYWKVAVADMHRNRYPQPDPGESTKEFAERVAASLQSGLTRIHSCRRVFVDEELLKLSDDLCRVDQEYIELIGMTEQTRHGHVNAATDVSAEEAVKSGQELLGKIGAGEIETAQLTTEWSLPTDLVNRAVAIDATRLEQQSLIADMQAKLKSKYPKADFYLPE